MKKILVLALLGLIFISCGSEGKLPFKGSGFGGPQNNHEAKLGKIIKNTPIVLVHGLFCSSSLWQPFREYFLKKGYTSHEIFAIDYTDSQNVFENEMKDLSKFIKNVRKYTGSEKIILVGHSKGGILIRIYIQMTAGKNITHAITFASPNKGTPKSRSHYTRPGSRFLKSLNSTLFGVKHLCFAAETDRYFPGSYRNYAYINGAKNVLIPGTTHLNIINSKKAYDIMIEFIKE